MCRKANALAKLEANAFLRSHISMTQVGPVSMHKSRGNVSQGINIEFERFKVRRIQYKLFNVSVIEQNGWTYFEMSEFRTTTDRQTIPSIVS